MDASQKEEACCLARLMVAVTASGSITAMVKEGQGSLDPDSVTEMMQVLTVMCSVTSSFFLFLIKKIYIYIIYYIVTSCITTLAN